MGFTLFTLGNTKQGKKIGFVILIDLFASKTDYSDVDSSLYSLTSARADSSSS